MARFQTGVRTSNVTSGQAALEIIAGNRGCRLWSVEITLATAVTGVLGLGRPAAAGITPTTPATFACIEGVGFSQSVTALAWGTSPTAPTQFLNRASFPATVGAPLTWILPYGVWIPAGTTLTLHNIVGGPTYDIALELAE